MAGKKIKAPDALEDADIAVAEAVEPFQDTAAVQGLAALSELGDQPQMRVLCGTLIAAGLAAGKPRLARAGVRMLAAHTVATLAKDFVKKRVDRTRPRQALVKGDGAHEMKPGRSKGKEETSFPSGHSAGAAAVARAYAREFPEHKAAAAGAAGLIALAQIPRCAHYPTDVGSGLAIGLLSEALVDRLFPDPD